MTPALVNEDLGQMPVDADNSFQEAQFIHAETLAEINLNIWSDYQYDWTNLDPSYIRQLENGINGKGLQIEVVHKVILQMRNVHTNIPSSI